MTLLFLFLDKMSHETRRLVILISVISLLVVLLLNFFFFQKGEEQIFFNDLQDRISKVDRSFDEDFLAILMTSRPEDSISFSSIDQIPNSHSFFILSEEKELIYWSDFTLILDFSELNTSLDYQVLEGPYGTFLAKSRKVIRKDVAYWLIQLERLIFPGTIQNDYLITGANPDLFGNGRFQLFQNPQEGEFQIINNSGEEIFGISFQLGYLPAGKVGSLAILIFFTSVFLLYFLLSSDFVLKVWRKGKKWKAIGYSIIVVFAFRFLMILLNFPGAFFNLELFDPLNYASSWINPSLGDLWINTICIAFISGLIIYQLSSKRTHEKILVFTSKSEIGVLFLLVFSLSSIALFFFWSLPRDIINNSQWVLNIRFIPSFDWFQGISFLTLFLWGTIYVLLTITMSSLLVKLDPKKSQYYKFLLLLGFPIGAALAFFLPLSALVWFLHISFIAVLIRFELFKNVFRLGLDTFLTFFFACLVAAAIAGLSTRETEQEQLIQSKIRYANQNLIENDIITEFFLGEIFSRLKTDLFIQNRLADPLLSKEPIESKIRKIYLDNYFDQFEVSVRAYSNSGKLILGPSTAVSLDEVRNEVIKSDFATDVKGLYFLRGSEQNSGNRFVGFISIEKDGVSQGTILLELQQMNIQPTSVYPKLLLDRKFSEKLDPTQYDYAVFIGEDLISSSGNFNYVSQDLIQRLQEDKITKKGINQNGFHHLGIKDQDRLILISSPRVSATYFAGNISLYFVIFVFLTFLTILFNALLKGYQNFEFNYSTKLQLYLNFAFFFPILIISIITLGLLANSYREDLDRQYIQKATLIRGNLSSFLTAQNLSSDQDLLDEEVSYLANTIGSDIHLYSADGNLKATNRPNIFEKKILSPLINPSALAAIREANQNQFLADERIGKLNYKSVYLPIQSGVNQKILGIVAVPFFESEAELNALISDVLSNIFNAFVVIFILFLIVSYFVSKNLTFPFKVLTQKLKTTNLESNEPMIWTAKDEIGLLVNEYNNMLFKLEASKKVLASTEKESAWREMAKQVAHEIKNPLTPMKLTLQHLMRIDLGGEEEEQNRLKKSLGTLIHQVDALSGIASSFSTFAKMPLPKNEKMNFKQVLQQVLELFTNDDRVDLKFRDDSYTEDIPIYGDDKLFGRVISNLIINGIQSVENGQMPRINVWLWLSEKAMFLEITDNGPGIPVELQDKIFIPNFSTKSQGSGLGLAIAKSGVETAGGKIWFETENKKGTTFYLTFPLAD